MFEWLTATEIMLKSAKIKAHEVKIVKNLVKLDKVMNEMNPKCNFHAINVSIYNCKLELSIKEL